MSDYEDALRLKTIADPFRRYQIATRRIDKFIEEDRYFYHSVIAEQSGRTIRVGGKEMVMLGSYSYLGLLNHPRLVEAACRATAQFGTGAHGVRVLAGTTELHRELEAKLASFMAAEDALVFSSGFITNVATIGALVRAGDVIIGDEWNHASIVDGCTFSRAELLTFKHNDMDSLEACLGKAGSRHALVVVDAVFSMEGDVIDLPHVVRLCKKHGAILMIDEAHSLGVIGKTGRGIQEYFNMTPTDIDVKMGCLSKTLASCGGFIAGRSQLIRYLRHHARGYLFSSALPASQVAAASVAIDVVLDEPERLDHLWQLRHQYVEGLQKLGLETFGSQTPIVPIACRTEAIALEMTRLCRNAGLYVVPVFYPAVPLNRCRLRTCITASHTNEDIEFALRVLAEAGRAVGLIH